MSAKQLKKEMKILEIMAIPEKHDGGIWPSGLHGIPCQGCDVLIKKRELLRKLGVPENELPYYRGQA